MLQRETAVKRIDCIFKDHGCRTAGGGTADVKSKLCGNCKSTHPRILKRILADNEERIQQKRIEGKNVLIQKRLTVADEGRRKKIKKEREERTEVVEEWLKFKIQEAAKSRLFLCASQSKATDNVLHLAELGVAEKDCELVDEKYKLCRRCLGEAQQKDWFNDSFFDDGNKKWKCVSISERHKDKPWYRLWSSSSSDKCQPNKRKGRLCTKCLQAAIKDTSEFGENTFKENFEKETGKRQRNKVDQSEGQGAAQEDSDISDLFEWLGDAQEDSEIFSPSSFEEIFEQEQRKYQGNELGPFDAE